MENWKKAEEAKFMYTLKQKELEFLKKWKEDRKEKEKQREKILKDQQGRLATYNSQLQKKIAELQRRENKLCLMEEELKQKIGETGRQLASREKEMEQDKEQ